MRPNAGYPVVLDACVLAEAAVSDLFLRLSEEPRLVTPRWSEQIWAETRRTCVERLGWPDEIADSRITAAKNFFPEAMVSGFEGLIESCGNHPDDRHVLAAAIHSKTPTIVTFNVRDYRPEALQPWGIVAVHPSDCLRTLFDRNPAVVTSAIVAMGNKSGRSFQETLGRLAWYVRGFCEHVADSLAVDIVEVTPTEWRR